MLTSSSRNSFVVLVLVAALVLVLSGWLATTPSGAQTSKDLWLRLGISDGEGGGGRGGKHHGNGHAEVMLVPYDDSDEEDSEDAEPDSPMQVPHHHANGGGGDDDGKGAGKGSVISKHEEENAKLASAEPAKYLVRKLERNMALTASGSKAFKEYFAVQKMHRDALVHSAQPDTSGARFIMYRCDNNMGCGGLGDRLNGIVTSFYLALLTDRAFLIRWTRGCPWTHFVRPAYFDWRVPEEKVDKLSLKEFFAMDHFRDVQQFFSSEDVITGLRDFSLVTINSNMPWADIFLDNPYFKANVEKYRLKELNDRGLLQAFALRAIMRPTSLIEGVLEHLAVAMMDQGHELHKLHFIGLQIRTGGDGDWWDPGRVPREKVPTFFDAALDIAHPADGGSNNTLAIPRSQTLGPLKPVIFISTDSNKAITELTAYGKDKKVDVVTLEGLAGPITHIDRSGNVGTIERNLRTWADWFMLMATDNLVISRSGFGENAAALTCLPSIFFGFPFDYTVATAHRMQQGFCTDYSDMRVRTLERRITLTRTNFI